MGGIWLDGRTSGYKPVDRVIAEAGLNLLLYPGWETRSRSSGGFEALLGIVVHHTAGSPNGKWQSDWDYHAVGHADAPVANILLGRDGKVGLHAAGASNHAGKGGPLTTSKGTIPLDAANGRTIGIEAQNDGVGEIWQPVMLDAYERLVAALCNAYGMVAPDSIFHARWAPSRKIDPWGGSYQTPGFVYGGPRTWDRSGWESAVALAQTGGQAPEVDEGDLIDVYHRVAARRRSTRRGAA